MPFVELETWLQQHLPDLVNQELNPGATESELATLASTIGQQLPEGFCALYRWHNGQAGKLSIPGPFYGLDFLPLEKVAEHWQDWQEILTEHGAGADTYATSTPPGAITCTYANRGWIPFAYDWGGNYLGIDLAPDKQGTYGQVINFGRDEDNKYVLAPDIPTFIRWMLKQLAGGNFKFVEMEDGGLSWDTLDPPKSHFLDTLPIFFGEQAP